MKKIKRKHLDIWSEEDSDRAYRAIALAKALNKLVEAHNELDELGATVTNYLDGEDEVREKIVELLVGIEASKR